MAPPTFSVVIIRIVNYTNRVRQQGFGDAKLRRNATVPNTCSFFLLLVCLRLSWVGAALTFAEGSWRLVLFWVESAVPLCIR